MTPFADANREKPVIIEASRHCRLDVWCGLCGAVRTEPPALPNAARAHQWDIQ
jgi:hypothetical protein